MCGLIAMIPKNSSGFLFNDAEMFRQLLVIDGEFRGLDSTGVFQVQTNRQAFTLKSATIPGVFMATDKYKNFQQRMISSSKLVVGHNRKATLGAKTSVNAHPFHEGNIILVHNGTLNNHKELADTTVDSHAICKALNEGKQDEVIKKIEGAFALIWYNIETEKLYAVRNDERPLNLVETDTMWYLASEAWMVNAVAARHNKKVTNSTVIAPGLLYEFDPFARTVSTRKVEISPFKTVDLTSYSHWNGYQDRRQTHSKVTHLPVITSNPPFENTEDCALEGANFQHQPSNADKPKLSNITAKSFHDAFRVNDKVLIKITSLNTVNKATNQVSFRGVSVSPGLPVVDVNGDMWGVQLSQFPYYFENICEGSIAHTSFTTNGGASLRINKAAVAPVVTLWDGNELPFPEWEYVVNNCVCNECKTKIEIGDAPITSVKRLGIGTDAKYVVKCYDHAGEYNEGSDSNSTVQDGKQVGKNIGNGTHAIVVAQGSSTIQ